jgi:hypothetical protein
MRTDDVTAAGLNPAGIQPGWPDTVQFPSPAAGQPFTRVVPGDFAERLIAVTFTLTLDAVVANRVASLVFLDRNQVPFAKVKANNNAVASTSVTPWLMVGFNVLLLTVAGDSMIGLPDILLTPGQAWQIVVSGMDVGDTITGINASVWRYPMSEVEPSPGG